MRLSITEAEEFDHVQSFNTKGYAGQSIVWDRENYDESPWAESQWVEIDETEKRYVQQLQCKHRSSQAGCG